MSDTLNTALHKCCVYYFKPIVKSQCTLITGPPNGPVLFCLLSSVVVCNDAGGRAVGRARVR